MAIPEETQRAISRALNALTARAYNHGQDQRTLGEHAATPVTIGEYETSLATWHEVKARAAQSEARLKEVIGTLTNLLRDAGVIR